MNAHFLRRAVCLYISSCDSGSSSEDGHQVLRQFTCARGQHASTLADFDLLGKYPLLAKGQFTFAIRNSNVRKAKNVCAEKECMQMTRDKEIEALTHMSMYASK